METMPGALGRMREVFSRAEQEGETEIEIRMVSKRKLWLFGELRKVSRSFVNRDECSSP